MKVRCKSCGKFFDYENYYGICPKCGAYYGAKEQLSETFEVEEALKEPLTNYTEATYEEKAEYKVTEHSEIKYKEKKKFSFGSEKITALFIILIIICPIITACLILASNKKILKECENQIAPEPIYATTDETLTIPSDKAEYSIRITDVSVDEDERYNIPDELSVITVSYQIDVTAQDEYHRASDDNRIYDSALSYALPYLHTKSGYYLKPISVYTISDIKCLPQVKEEEQGISDTFEYKSGKFYFLVDPDDVDSLLINLCSRTDNFYQYTLLQKSIIFSNLEVTK